MLFNELMEDVRDLLEMGSSEHWELVPLFSVPGFGTNEAGAPLANKGSNAE